MLELTLQQALAGKKTRVVAQIEYKASVYVLTLQRTTRGIAHYITLRSKPVTAEDIYGVSRPDRTVGSLAADVRRAEFGGNAVVTFLPY